MMVLEVSTPTCQNVVKKAINHQVGGQCRQRLHGMHLLVQLQVDDRSASTDQIVFHRQRDAGPGRPVDVRAHLWCMREELPQLRISQVPW